MPKKWRNSSEKRAVLLPGDLSDEVFCKKLIRDALEKLGGLDIMALVAGKQVAVEDIRDITTEQLTKTFEVNVFSLFWIAKEALRASLPAPPFRPTSPART